MSPPVRLIITCEHGGNEVPVELAEQFASPQARRWLQSHRGWDPGSLPIARHLAARMHATLHLSTVSRLVVDLNRSQGHPQLFSPFTAVLPESHRQRLLQEHYLPYRQPIEDEVASEANLGNHVIHLSVHTFTPVFRAVRRNLDVGLLYDPSRAGEDRFCQAWRRHLLASSPRLRVSMNAPYAGVDDGLTTYLRSRFSDANYLGIELEVNNRFAKHAPSTRERLLSRLTDTLAKSLTEWNDGQSTQRTDDRPQGLRVEDQRSATTNRRL